MIASGFLAAGLFCAAIWLFMHVMKLRILNGLWRRTWAIGTMGFAGLALVLRLIGV